MNLRVVALGLSFLLAPGCYLVHGTGSDGGPARDGAGGRDTGPVGRDAGPRCAAPGSYDTRVRFEEIDPADCFSAPTDRVPINIPPRVEDFGMMCDGMSGRVVELGPCEWMIDTECAVPDASTSIRGVIDALGGAVHGRLEVTLGSIAGECRATIVLGE